MSVSHDHVSEDRFLFAEELRALRKLKGWTTEECGAAINFSASTIKSIESCYRIPTAEQATKLDEAFGTPGTMQRWYRRIRGIPLSASFRPFAPYEAEATVLRTFEHVLVPGLFQTADYARVLIGSNPGNDPDEVAAFVEARIGRQTILDRKDPPWLWVVLDEQVLSRGIGGPEVMHAQLTRLVGLADRPRITIQVIPADVTHPGLDGAFTIAENKQPPAIVHLAGAAGHTVENADTAEKMSVLFDTLRSVALPAAASRALIEEETQRWKERITT